MPRSISWILTALLPALAALFAASAGWAQAPDPEIEARWLFEANAVHPGGTLHAGLHVTLNNKKFHLQSNTPLDEFLIPTVLEISPAQGITVGEIVYPQALEFRMLGDVVMVLPHEFVIGVALKVADDLRPGVYPFTGELEYQACDDKACLPPTTLKVNGELRVVAAGEAINKTGDPLLANVKFTGEGASVIQPSRPPRTTPVAADEECDIMAELAHFEVMGTAGGYMGADSFIKFIDQAESGTANRNPFEDLGPVAIVLAVIIGGILLNLTPCVLPLIPINLAIIGAGAQAGSRGRGFALGGAYGLAMAVVYGALGLIVILTAASFGTINSTIWFNVAIAVLFVVLALAMFDVIAIDFTRFQSKIDASGFGKQGALALAFGMGGVTALLAGACVAPIVIVVILYASDQYAKGSAIALALPFLLGVGMALPWPFAGAGLSFLPKPGMWMVRVKQVMGVFIIAFAGYYGYLAYEIWRIEQLGASGQAASSSEMLEGGWTPSLCAGLAQARAEDKPVFIDMWATWCKNCLAMDKTTFKDERVLARLDGFVKIKYQAEKLDEAPASEVLKHFDGIGLPHYAVLRPRAAVAD